ncbi:glycosyl hydrolase [Thermostilla marina]
MMFGRLCVLWGAVLVGVWWASVLGAEETAGRIIADTPDWTLPEAFLQTAEGDGPLEWPPATAEARPGAYWWWPGNAVSEQDLTWNLETYRRAGWGNLGVIGIYGVRGEEDRFVDIFSRRWFALFNHAVREANRLGMNIDLTPGSGWRLGGPHITPAFGEQTFTVEDGRIVARPVAAKVKRAGPGGEGLAVNPYSQSAVAYHFDWLAQRFAEGEGLSPRAFYYDSFENPGNWCAEFLDAFARLRGYRLDDHAADLAQAGKTDESRRIVCDYRETLSELLIERIREIVAWCEARGSLLRVQAHGAPANLLDMYAAAGIPETEVFGATKFDIPGFRRDPRWIRPDRQSDLVNRFASSAAHVAGRPLVISESFTWLREHFHVAPSHIKAEADNLLLNGINGIYYHGICFAPRGTAWPGWLFYASTQANCRNSIFRDLPVVNAYITRCQSVLQQGRCDNDILLYWPIYDLWMEPGGKERRFTVHDPDWIEGTPCGELASLFLRRGFTFDFVSDAQLQSTRCDGKSLVTPGGATYRVIVVPEARYMKTATLSRLADLARRGAIVLFRHRPPQDVPGFADYAARRESLQKQAAQLPPADGALHPVGEGRIGIGSDLEAMLQAAGVRREAMVDHGLKFIRRRCRTHVVYFIANHSAETVDAWVPLRDRFQSAVLMDPMHGKTGVGTMRERDGRTEIFLQLLPGETRIVRAYPDRRVEGTPFPLVRCVDPPIPVEGSWHVRFVEGGPTLPHPQQTDALRSWTEFGDPEAERFAGAARYTIAVELKNVSGRSWFLDLGDVRESARVWIDGKPAGVAVAHPFRVEVTGLVHDGKNELTIEVTNLSANRIRDLDRRGVAWKKFYDINIVDHDYHPLDASQWPVVPSGLLGPVVLRAAVPLDPIGSASQK